MIDHPSNFDEWVKAEAKANPKWTPERVAQWVTRGWSFLGQSPEKHRIQVNRIIALINDARR